MTNTETTPTPGERLRKLATVGVIVPIPSYAQTLLELADEFDDIQERLGRAALDGLVTSGLNRS